MNGIKYSYDKVDHKKQLRRMRFQERIYKNNFSFFELTFIVFIIPILMLSFFSVPIFLYYMVAGRFILWPIIIAIVITLFLQILAFQYFIRRFYLEPHNMTLGEYMRYLLDIRIAKIYNKGQSETKKTTWYDDIDPLIEKIRTDMKEQTEKIYSQIYSSYYLE